MIPGHSSIFCTNFLENFHEKFLFLQKQESLDCNIIGISQDQYYEIKDQYARNPQRAAQMLYDALLRLESGYMILTACLHGSKQTTLAEDLEIACNKEIENIRTQVKNFISKGKTEEKDRNNRNELIRMLRRQFNVKEDGIYVLKQ